MYLSGTTFITLGMGVPHTRVARAVLVLEAGIGFGFLALVISYLPVLYQSFAQRETSILLLDARAGSPPTAAELLRRYATGHGLAALDRTAAGVGDLVGGSAGNLHFVPGTGVLSLAAR